MCVCVGVCHVCVCVCLFSTFLCVIAQLLIRLASVRTSVARSQYAPVLVFNSRNLHKECTQNSDTLVVASKQDQIPPVLAFSSGLLGSKECTQNSDTLVVASKQATCSCFQ